MVSEENLVRVMVIKCCGNQVVEYLSQRLVVRLMG